MGPSAGRTGSEGGPGEEAKEQGRRILSLYIL